KRKPCHSLSSLGQRQMILVLPELADNAFEVLNARAPGKLRAIRFIYAPSPDRIIVDRYEAMLHDQLMALLGKYSGNVDYSRIEVGAIYWIGGQERSLATLDINRIELSNIP